MPLNPTPLRLDPPPELPAEGQRHSIAIVGGGPTGLTLACDLAQRGVEVVLLDRKAAVARGSRAICFAQRSLEIFDRLGCVAPMRAKGVTWNVGRLFHRQREVFAFDLQPNPGQAHPAFINLQQYYVEEHLIRRAEELGVGLYWQSEVTGLEVGDDGAVLEVESPQGPFRLQTDWLIAADGAHSSIRRSLGLDWPGIAFSGKFLITDVVIDDAGFPPERWFWFDPPFHPGYSALLHSQPDRMWRIDLQLAPDADAELEQRAERVEPRVRSMLGPEVDFEIAWISLYSFQSRCLERFRHGPVFFAGDAAHLMSPFGARGANSGIQDADNLGWKLAAVLTGEAPGSLLDTYDEERRDAALQNLHHTEASTAFISPATSAQLALREAVLELAATHELARPLINSGRLSRPTPIAPASLLTTDAAAGSAGPAPGEMFRDLPLAEPAGAAYLSRLLAGAFTVLILGDDTAMASAVGAELDASGPATDVRVVLLAERSEPRPARVETAPRQTRAVVEPPGIAGDRYGSCVYLLRPDGYVAARWARLQPGALHHALRRALGQSRD